MHRAKTVPEWSGKEPAARDDPEQQPFSPQHPSPTPVWTRVACTSKRLPLVLLAALLALCTLLIIAGALGTRRSVLVPVSSFSYVQTLYTSSSTKNGEKQVQTSMRATATQYTTTTTTTTSGGGVAAATSIVGPGQQAGTPQQQAAKLVQQAAFAKPDPVQQARQEELEDEQQAAADKAAHAQQLPSSMGGARISATRMAEVPADFDWKTYLNYYPKLRRKGIDSEAKAKEHYATAGYRDRRIYKKLRVTLRYTACGGLSNQQYSHIAAITLAHHLQASLVFPPALSRNSFASYFHTDPTRNRVAWRATPADSMWDTEYLQNYWKPQGLDISMGPVDAPAPDLSHPETAFPTTLPPGYTNTQVARLRNVYLSSKSLAALLRQATDAVVATAMNLPDRDLPLLLDLPCTLFMLRTKTAPRIVKQAADSLHFHPRMSALADTVISRLQLPQGAFNGLHLRMEDDAKDWATILGGRERLLQMYLDACNDAGFDSKTPVYLASGLFTYGKMDEYKRNIVTQLKKYSSKLRYKEEVLTKEDTKDLTKEQLALLDFLVLARSSKFVGIGVSTFSHYLREYRSLQGQPKSTSVLVDGSVIGTDDLFSSCAYVTELATTPPGKAAPGAANPPDAIQHKQRQLLARQVIPETCGF